MSPASPSPWPSVGKKSANSAEHRRFVHHEAQLLLAQTNPTVSRPGKPLPKKRAIPAATATQFLESIIEYLGSQSNSNNQGDAILQAIQRLEDLTMARNASPHASSSSENNNSKGTRASYASVAQGAAGSPLSHVNATSSTAARVNSLKAREIRIIIGDPHIITKIKAQGQQPAKIIVARANEAIAKSGINNGAQSTASTKWIQSARLMASGDVFLYAKDAPTAERLQYSRKEWQGFLGEGAAVNAPTYGVIMSNVPTTVNVSDQEHIFEQLLDDNTHLIQHGTMVKAHWLTKPKPGKTTNALVVEFNTAEAANLCIAAERIAFEGTPKRTQKYCREAQLCQCYRCYGYNHTARLCAAKEKCGFCGTHDHTTSHHPDQRDKSQHRCALCKENHTAWSPLCKHRKAAVAKVVEAKKKLMIDPLFPVTTTNVTPGVSARGSRQTTAPTSHPSSSADEDAMDGIQLSPATPATAPTVSPKIFSSVTVAKSPAPGLQSSQYFQPGPILPNMFGPTTPFRPLAAAATPIRPAVAMESSPLQGTNNDGFILAGKRKRGPLKKLTTDKFGRKVFDTAYLKSKRMRASGQFDAINQLQEELVQESAVVTAAPLDCQLNGSDAESANAGTASQESTSSSGSSLVSSTTSDGSGIVTRSKNLSSSQPTPPANC